MKTDALIIALQQLGIEPAIALRLFAMWLDSTAQEMELQLRDADADTLRALAGHLIANVKHLEGN